ncbi:MAG: hypothetical protein H7A42_01985 [Chlamydiales bacterium]|nr:hypothetical protein [Chlamydiales bacterium]
MRYLLFCLITILLISSNSKLVARQYNIDYLLQLIEDGNKEEVQNFFAKPDYVTKIKHAIEFAEVFRSKLEEKYGYKPSWREAYDCFKDLLPQMSYPKEQKKQFLTMFKEIALQFESAKKLGTTITAKSINYQGSLDPKIEIPDELAGAFCEALGGSLYCIIPGIVTQGIGVGLIVDAGRRSFDYFEKRRSIGIDAEGADNYSEPFQPENDMDSWEKQY